MTTTLTRTPSSVTSTARGRSAPPKPAATTASSGRRNRSRIAAGAAVLALCVLGATTLYARASQRTDVITVRRSVAAGQTITRDDLETHSISADATLRTTPAADMTRIIGKTASVALAPGALLVASQYSDAPRVPEGSVIVGATLKPGQYPVGLRDGDTVTVIETAPPGTAGAPIERGTARIVDVQQLKDAGSTIAVSLVVPAAASTAIANAGSAGRVTVVVVGVR